MNITELDCELILLILKQFDDYKWCIRFLMTCKQLYSNEYLIKNIKDYFTEHKINNSTQICYFNGKFHREDDKPAVIWSNGTQRWYFYGKRHRDNNKPAVIYENGCKEYWVNGTKIKKE